MVKNYEIPHSLSALCDPLLLHDTLQDFVFTWAFPALSFPLLHILTLAMDESAIGI